MLKRLLVNAKAGLGLIILGLGLILGYEATVFAALVKVAKSLKEQGHLD